MDVHFCYYSCFATDQYEQNSMHQTGECGMNGLLKMVVKIGGVTPRFRSCVNAPDGKQPR